jgi:hypothetical protein
MKMKAAQMLGLIALSLVAFPAWAMQGTTKDGHVACAQEQWLKDMVSFVSAGDKDSFSAYLSQNRCLVMKGGLRVTVTDSPGMFGGRTGFVFQGTKLWTVREGIEYGQ